MPRSFHVLFKLFLIVISIRGRANSVGTALNTVSTESFEDLLPEVRDCCFHPDRGHN